jgi:hypothetical protein
MTRSAITLIADTNDEVLIRAVRSLANDRCLCARLRTGTTCAQGSWRQIWSSIAARGLRAVRRNPSGSLAFAGLQPQEDRTPAVQCRERTRQRPKRIACSLYTLTLTDGATGWTECLALLQPQIRR